MGWTITLHTVLVPALLAFLGRHIRKAAEGAVSNEKTWRQRKGREHAGSTGLMPAPALHPRAHL